jgi:hypothetical protein
MMMCGKFRTGGGGKRYAVDYFMLLFQNYFQRTVENYKIPNQNSRWVAEIRTKYL